ncbi:FERM domain-containing 3-like protein [Labeo rohita]|uniref:FERM domain-containing 3-like protein n=1 Tax=Labeo rohita TaxID=84645 RepID=A0A498LZ63_LABRO|nr:FERM domain-containing 3-like protein [Labeo rohita]
MEVIGEQEECVVSHEKVAEEGLREEDVDEVLKSLDEGLEERVDAMRCQVKITTRHNLHLRMANYTARDVYVRLLGHGDRISGTGMEASKILLK